MYECDGAIGIMPSWVASPSVFFFLDKVFLLADHVPVVGASALCCSCSRFFSTFLVVNSCRRFLLNPSHKKNCKLAEKIYVFFFWASFYKYVCDNDGIFLLENQANCGIVEFLSGFFGLLVILIIEWTLCLLRMGHFFHGAGFWLFTFWVDY